MKIIQAGWVCPVSGPPVRDAEVVVDKGKIVEVRSGLSTSVESRDSYPNAAILPGFVNAHTHLELTVLRGFLENLPFEQWLRRLTRAKYEHLFYQDLLVSARLGAMECLLAGVTTVGEVMDIGTGWDAMIELGLGGIAYQEVFGPSDEQADVAMNDLEERLRRARDRETQTQRLGVSPHAPFTVSETLYRRVRDLASSQSLPIAVHVAESEDEVAFVREGTGPFALNWKGRDIPLVAHGTGPLAYLDRLGMLGERTLAIHAIHSSPAEIGRMADVGTSVVHCPKSNMKLGHQIAPVTEFIAAGVTVGLGTDSVASNNNVDMFEEMRMAIYLQRTRTGNSQELGARQVLRMATLNGAQCLGLEDQVGSLEAGKLADLVLVDLSDPALSPVYDPVDAIVFSGSRKNVVATYLGGERVEVDPRATIHEAQAIAHRLEKLEIEDGL
jgi:cytosine/adenosine deaminase-related metal-dependent hydrolase